MTTPQNEVRRTVAVSDTQRIPDMKLVTLWTHRSLTTTPVRWRLVVVASSIAQVLAGCVTTPEFSGPCDQDAFGCDDGGELVLDAHCSNDEPLMVEVGQGRDEFEPLEAEMAPEIDYGDQGGRHVFLAARVLNPDPDHGTFELGFRLAYSSPDSGDALFERVLVVRGDRDVRIFEQTGMVLVIDPPYDSTSGLLELRVRDSCGRIADASHAFVVSER